MTTQGITNEQKVAIVTGAGSGVGKAAAELLSAAGYDVVLAARTREKLEATAQSCNGRSLIACTDLCDPKATRALVQKAVSHFGRLDALANIAGHAPLVPIAQVTAELSQQVIDTNLTCVVNLTAEALPVLRRGGGGVIVNVSSMASLDPFPGLGIYASAKAGLNMFTRVTAAEGAPDHITATVIAPGAIETPMLRAVFDEQTIGPHQTLDPRTVAQLVTDCITGLHQFESGSLIELPSP